MATVTPISELRLSETAALIEGKDETLRVVSIHPSPTVQQTNL